MKLNIEKSIYRDLNKISNPKLNAQVDRAILAVKAAVTLKDIPRLKKLKGYRIHYRIRVGDYRIGIAIEGDTVTFLRCLPRKDFYRVFP